MDRLARSLLGKSIGLVLGGGGAKGFSHVGVIQALHERGVPIDMVGGTSMGSFIGAAYAMEEGNFGPFKDRCLLMGKRMDYKIPQILDITYPVTAMLSGRHMNRVIQKSLEFDNYPGEMVMIEDLWLPYFCVTTDISAIQPRIHTDGDMWRYVRASMSLSGYLPPLCDPKDGNMLVDGGYVNNLPVDVMYEKLDAHQVIAVDVEGKFEELANFGDAVSGSSILWHRYNPVGPSNAPIIPNQGEIQSRLAYVTSTVKLQELHKNYGFEYFRPPIDEYGTIQFSAAAEIADVGLRFARGRAEEMNTEWDRPKSVPSSCDLKKVLQTKSPKFQRGKPFQRLSLTP